MKFDALLAAAAAAVSLLGCWVVYRRTRDWKIHLRLLALASVPGLLWVAVFSACYILIAPVPAWNQIRLAPLFALAHGYRLYYPPGEGPVMGVIYGPLAYLPYFPSLAASGPVAAVLIGTLTAAALYFGPAVWVLAGRRPGPRVAGVFAAVAFGLWTLSNYSLRYCAFSIHADAPALGFGAAACAALMSGNIVTAGVLAAFAIAAKQSVLFLIPALVLFAWVADGRRAALRLAAAALLMLAAILGVLAASCSLEAVVFNLYTFPSRHPLALTGYMEFPARTVENALLALSISAKVLWDHARWMVMCGVICCLVEFGRRPPAPVEWLRANRWAVFYFVAAAGLPFAILFRAKAGGDQNAYGLHLYFGLIGLLMFCRHLIAQPEVSRPAAAACLALAATLAPAVVVSPNMPLMLRQVAESGTQRIYDYARRHPGETYFPAWPLPVLMAEGRMYHFDYGLFDRELGGAKVQRDHFLRHIPSGMKYLGGPDVNSPVRRYLPEFSSPASLPELPGMELLARRP